MFGQLNKNATITLSEDRAIQSNLPSWNRLRRQPETPASFRCRCGHFYLLRVLEMSPEMGIYSLGGFLWVTGHSFDVNFQAALQKLVHLPVVVIIIPGKVQTEEYRKLFFSKSSH